MKPMNLKVFVAAILVGGLLASPAEAIIPVTDVGAILQLIQQLNYWKQQIQAMSDQLSQAQSAYRSTTGTRGMERVASGTTRNYLPVNFADLSRMSTGSGTLGSEVQGVVNANAVLTPQALAALPAAERQNVLDQRRATALWQVISREAVATTSARFATLQQLIDAVPQARDPKAIADLQARIAGEQAMLANDQSKLQALYQTAQAEEAAAHLRAREQAISSFGSLRTLTPMGLE